MDAFLHNWVCGLAFAGALCAVCMYLCPAGRVKYVLQMASACVMVLALFAPLLRLDPALYTGLLSAYREESAAVAAFSDTGSERLNRMVIERECVEYIWDKARTYNVDLNDVTVRATWDDNGYWVPYEAVYETTDGTVPAAFTGKIAEELGIPKERQKACETNE